MTSIATQFGRTSSSLGLMAPQVTGGQTHSQRSGSRTVAAGVNALALLLGVAMVAGVFVVQARGRSAIGADVEVVSYVVPRGFSMFDVALELSPGDPEAVIEALIEVNGSELVGESRVIQIPRRFVQAD